MTDTPTANPTGVDSVEHERIQSIASSAHRVPLPVFILVACLALTAVQHPPWWAVVAWLGLATGAIGVLAVMQRQRLGPVHAGWARR